MRISQSPFLLSACLAVIFSAPSVLGADPAPRPIDDPPVTSPRYDVAPTAATVDVDGMLNEPAWQAAVTLPLNYEWMPGDGVTPPVETVCLITHDHENLYVAFRAQDPDPNAIRAHLMDRDEIRTFVQDDHVSLTIDPFNDERRGFQFRVNPLGVQVDAIFSELDGVEDFSWDATWASAGQITAEGYVVELAIPFNQLRFPNAAGVQTWGFSAGRSYPRSVRHRIASNYRDRNRSCLLCQFNKVTGFENIAASKNLEVAPTFTARRTDRRTDLPDGGFDAGSIAPSPGVTARWSPMPNVTFNGALNPDFSQVEADVAQLEANNRFALFFPERRPFFLEGADFFQTPLQAVFTRTVADPIGGIKTTSKFGRNAVGVFATRDRVNSLLFPSNQGSASSLLEREVSSSVLRYRRDVGQGSAIGALYTGRASSDYRNHVGGVDGFLRLSPTNTLSFQYLRSATGYPTSVVEAFDQQAGAFGGNAFKANLAHRSRHWSAFARYSDLSPTFRADNGFFPRVDTRTGEVQAVRRIWGPNHAWFSSINVGVNAERTHNYDGTLTDQDVIFLATYSGPLQSVYHAQLNLEKDRFAGVMYNQTSFVTMARLQPVGALRMEVMSFVGDHIDFANQRAATSFRIDPQLTWKVGRHVSVGVNYSMQRLKAAGARLFTEQLLQTRLLYHFNVRAFVRATVQYRSVDRNVANYTMPVSSHSDRVFTQLLFSYTLNPQSVLFIGYSGNARGADDFALTPTDRSFFLKLGYAWTL